MSERDSVSPAKRRNWTWPAFAWGFFEATIFFIVPDVLLTRIALRHSYRTTLLACGAALAGALLGGASLWFIAQGDAALPLLRASHYIPGISGDLIAETGQALQTHGTKALLVGGLIGQPYKLFALHAGAQQIPLGKFLVASAIARFGRFVFVATLAWIAGRALRRYPEEKVLKLHTSVWLTFYAVWLAFYAINSLIH